MNFSIHRFENLTSTLDEAVDPKYKHLDVITTRFQSAGRGQRGNKWVSDEGLNLMTTIVIEPVHIAVNEQFVVSMIASLATAEAVRSFGVEGVCVKWPNDIYVGQSKISGILIEHSFSSQMLGRSIIGIGINVCQREFEHSAASPTSLHLLGATSATVDNVLGRLCEAFARFYAMPVEELHRLYMESLYRRSGFYPFADSDGEFSARIAAIDAHSGVISLMDTDSACRDYYFKEVSYL